MTTIWKVGGHWYVGSPSHMATALELTIGAANEFTFGDYNFFCLGFYLDATVGPLVELILPFPYSIFGGTLVEIIIATPAVLTAAVVGGAAATAGALGDEAGGTSMGVEAGVAAGGFAAMAAVLAAFPSGCQMDLVYGNYFFTVYGQTTETVPDKHHHHDGVEHFHYAIQLLHSVTGVSAMTVQSHLVVASAGITLSAVGQVLAEGNTVILFGSNGVMLGATADVQLSGEAVDVAAAAQVSLVTATANITVVNGAITCNAATIYLNSTLTFSVAPFTSPVVALPLPTDEITTAMANLDAAVAAVGAAAGHGHP
jgi:hypothetical protein